MHIPELVEAGIDSFKIEGRMKRMEYSAYISHLYRKYTDIYLEKGKDAFQEMKENKESELWRDFKRSQDLYNRGGFSNSFLFEKDKSDIVFTEKNGHYGTPVGTVVTCNKRTAQFQVLEELHYQDVLEFRNEDGSQAYEYTVKDPEKKGAVVQTNIMPGSHIYSGQTIYRTKNTWLLEKVQKMDEALDFLKEDLGRKVYIEEVADYMGITEEEVWDILKLTGEDVEDDKENIR